MIHRYVKETIWLEKTFDLLNGYGWHCQVCNRFDNGTIGYGFSKNKFTAYRIALKDSIKIVLTK